MIHARFHINAVMLPDRTVFVSGGNGQSEAAATAVLEAEIYDPATDTWTAAATAQAARMYHSIALLLPDGRVLAAGSNPNRRDDELRLEIYHPPYLFRGPRPFIETSTAADPVWREFRNPYTAGRRNSMGRTDLAHGDNSFMRDRSASSRP